MASARAIISIISEHSTCMHLILYLVSAIVHNNRLRRKILRTTAIIIQTGGRGGGQVFSGCPFILLYHLNETLYICKYEVYPVLT